ncbi:hypothetical protein [uncultured Hyphomonas sp.]|uniref:hypothetical protein n=1 Tax=uncultured Hyphomonas sp. TaxID=225298 RepID=UPI002AAAB1F9|nr:hypothetical protein [uncultured Hyphomonas sp.]
MFHHKVQYNGREYSIELVLSEEAVEQGKLGFEITGTVRDLDEERREPEEVKLHLEVDLQEEVIIVRHKDDVIATIRLDHPSFEGLLEFPPGFAFSRPIEDVVFEEFLERIPAIDPVLGCLLRSAASTAVGQTVRCWRRWRDQVEGFRRLARAIAGCLKTNGWRMAGVFVFRTGRCFLMGGV